MPHRSAASRAAEPRAADHLEPVGVIAQGAEPEDPDVLSFKAYKRLLADPDVQKNPPKSIYVDRSRPLPESVCFGEDRSRPLSDNL